MDNYLRRDAVEKFLTDYEQVAEKVYRRFGERYCEPDKYRPKDEG